jgi:ribosome maturation factor RimP
MRHPLAAVERQLSEAVEAEGYEVVEIVLASAGAVRITIDFPGGVGLDDCVEVHRRVRDFLTGLGHDPGDYRIEVESPGADRLLRTPEDFERFRGERVRVTLREKRDGRKRFVGVLEGHDDGKVIVDVEAIGRTEFAEAELESVRLHV